MWAAMIGVLFVCAVTHTASLKCYGGEALDLTKKGESSCNTLSKAFSSWCWQRCGAISYFEGQCGGRLKEQFSLCQGQQKGKKLCPELRSKGCNCTGWSGWDGKFKGDGCPGCDDFTKLAPIMMSKYPDAQYASSSDPVECPEGHDMCFSYCHKIPYYNTVLKDGTNKCSFGCIKKENRPYAELQISQSLADADFQHKQNALGSIWGNQAAGHLLASPYSPNHYKKCDGSSATYDCKVKFCTTDGCNTFEMSFWEKHTVLKAFMYPICILGGLAVIGCCVTGLPCMLVVACIGSVRDLFGKENKENSPLINENDSNAKET